MSNKILLNNIIVGKINSKTESSNANKLVRLPKPSYVFFWHEYAQHGVFSQWYPCDILEGDILFSCAEQYMMYHKAKLFNNNDIASKILKTTSPSIMKSLGRDVTDFDEKTWESKREEIVYQGNYLKFTQNKELYNTIMKYPKGTIFVEASPYDRIWGIGYNESNALYHRNKWGKNLLGKIIGKINSDLHILSRIVEI